MIVSLFFEKQKELKSMTDVIKKLVEGVLNAVKKKKIFMQLNNAMFCLLNEINRVFQFNEDKQ